MSDIRASALLVGSQDQACILFKRNSQLFYGSHGVESGNCRSFIICGTASKELISFYHRFKRFRLLPAFPGRYYIQMGQNIQLALFLIQIHGSYVIIVIRNGESVVFSHGKSLSQRRKRALAVWHAFLIRHFLTVNPAQSTDVFKHLLSVCLDKLLNLFSVHVLSFPAALTPLLFHHGSQNLIDSLAVRLAFYLRHQDFHDFPFV